MQDGQNTGGNEKQDNNWLWENYWQGDRVALCLDTDYLEYDEALSNDWKTFFSDFDDGASLLDICTGNGAVATLAVQASQEAEKTFGVTGVDRAEIDPARFVTSNAEILEKISFKGGVDIAELPFPDASFDGVSGQYALEYTDTSLSLAEIRRVLKPGGRARFLLHAKEGNVVLGSSDELARIEAFRAAANVFKSARQAMTAAIKLKKTPSPRNALKDKVGKTESQFRAALQACWGTYQENDKDFIFGTITRLVNVLQAVPHYEEHEVMEQYDKIEASLDAHEGRLRALVSSAVTYEDCIAFAAALASQGGNAEPISPAAVEDRQIGWVVDIKVA